MGTTDLFFMLAIALLTVALFVFFFKQIIIISFDEEFAKARKLPVNFFNHLLIIVSALVIVSSIRISGVILVLSLLTIPQATANLFTNRFSFIMLWSIAIVLVWMLLGLFISYYTDLPSGATIILVLTTIWGAAKIFSSVKKLH